MNAWALGRKRSPAHDECRDERLGDHHDHLDLRRTHSARLCDRAKRRGDVVALADAAGEVFATYGYDAFGAPRPDLTTSRETSAVPHAETIATEQPLRYAGYVFDTHSGLYYCSQRYYDPQTMQFLTKDPARADGEESAYQYCGGDPVGKVDPTGLVAVIPDVVNWWRGIQRVRPSASKEGADLGPLQAVARLGWYREHVKTDFDVVRSIIYNYYRWHNRQMYEEARYIYVDPMGRYEGLRQFFHRGPGRRSVSFQWFARKYSSDVSAVSQRMWRWQWDQFRPRLRTAWRDANAENLW